MSRVFSILAVLLLGSLAAARAEELVGREKQIVQAIESTIRQAGGHFQAGRFDESADSIRRAMNQVDAAMKVATPRLHDAILPAMDRIATAHALLELEGVRLPPFRRPTRPEVAPEPIEMRSPRVEGSGSVSFIEQVAPILVSRCGRCHVDQARGEFSANSYAALMRGTSAGTVIFPGDVVASRLIETIETGDMPRGGGSVPAEELQTLKAWILAGAAFDGPDPEASLPRGGDASRDTAEASRVRRPNGGETVSFAGDVAPLLIDNCRGCHIDARQSQGGLRMDNFAQLIRGGDSGPVLIPGRANESLLIRKLRGMEGQRMPAGGRPPLSDEAIALVATWIDEGATLDGADENQSLAVMSQLAWAATATTEEKSARRAELAGRSLKLAVKVDSRIQPVVTEHFLIMGSSSPNTLQRVADAAESELKEVRRNIAGSAAADYFGGRVTVFVLPRRYDYSEFAKMVEGRGIPTDWMGHWRFDGLDAYVALVAGDDEDRKAIAGRLVGPLTSLAIATRGRDVPRWLAEGVGTASAIRAATPSARQARRQTDLETAEAISVMGSGKRFLEGKLTPMQVDRIGAAVAGTLLDRANRRSFDQFLRNLDAGIPFEDSFTQAFRLKPVDFLDRWLGRPPGSN